MIRESLEVGDCLILNEAEQPGANMIVVVCDAETLVCKYLNADRTFSSFNRKPFMVVNMKESTLVRDFGVVIEVKGKYYNCVQLSDSKATYRDGANRRWQGQAYRYKFRPELMKLVVQRSIDIASALPSTAEGGEPK